MKKNSIQNLVFVITGLLCVVSWYFYKPQIISFSNSYINFSQELSVNTWNTLEGVSFNFWSKSEELSVNSWNSYTNLFQKVSFPALKLPALVLPSFDFKLPTFKLPTFTFPSFKLPTFSLPPIDSPHSWQTYTNSLNKISFSSFSWPSFTWPSFSLPTFKLPSFDFKLPTFKLPTFDFKKIFGTTETQSNPPLATTNTVIKNTKSTSVKDCGTSIAPKLDTASTYENNSVLSCLGVSAINCENAKGILEDDFFPTVFEITQSSKSGSCNFKLSYSADSALTDVTGKKLAGQTIMCPLSIVKAIDNTKPATPKFIVPDKADFSKYGSQIYFYGTLGLFIENNLDQNKISGLGCSGMYIDSVIASYQKTQN